MYGISSLAQEGDPSLLQFFHHIRKSIDFDFESFDKGVLLRARCPAVARLMLMGNVNKSFRRDCIYVCLSSMKLTLDSHTHTEVWIRKMMPSNLAISKSTAVASAYIILHNYVPVFLGRSWYFVLFHVSVWHSDSDPLRGWLNIVIWCDIWWITKVAKISLHVYGFWFLK